MKKPWKFEKELQFLRPFLAPCESQVSNLEPEESTPEPVEDSVPIYYAPELISDESVQMPGTSAPQLPSPIPQTATPKSLKRKRKETSSGSVATVLSNYLERTNPLASNPQNTDAITHFFLSMAETVKGFPPELQLRAKRLVFDAVSNCEMEAINKEKEGVNVVYEYLVNAEPGTNVN